MCRSTSSLQVTASQVSVSSGGCTFAKRVFNFVVVTSTRVARNCIEYSVIVLVIYFARASIPSFGICFSILILFFAFTLSHLLIYHVRSSGTALPLPDCCFGEEGVSNMVSALSDRQLIVHFCKMILNGEDSEITYDFLNRLMEHMAIKDMDKESGGENLGIVIEAMFKTLLEHTNAENRRLACVCLVNVSSTSTGLIKVMAYINNDVNPDDQGVISKLLSRNVTVNAPCLVKIVLKLLCNITRDKNNAIKVYKGFVNPLATFNLFMDLFNKCGYDLERHYDFVSYLISNLCQLHEVRMLIMEKGILEHLLAFLSQDREIRRSGVIKTIKNCSFELEKHEWLLSEELNLLPRLLLPLAGPERFDDEDNEKLPLDLQYLPDDKERESSSTLRIELLEALTQLCAKKSSREILRNQGTYLILRELHAWEQDVQAKLVCENLVDILIKTEDEIGVDNLRDVNVPEELVDKFEKMDKDYLN